MKEDDEGDDEIIAIEEVKADKLRFAGAEMGLWRDMKVEESMSKIEVWVHEVRVTWEANEKQEEVMLEEAWDDVKGGETPDRGSEESSKRRGWVHGCQGDLGSGSRGDVLAEHREETHRGQVGGH